VTRRGIAARKIDVRVRGDHPHRGWRALRSVLRGAALEPAVRDRSLAVFRRLIEAEAEAHGVAFERVHLHEAGGVDAIIDVVGACVALHELRPARIVVSPMTTGFGTVRCEHGVYPVPGPATMALVRGRPVRAGEIEVERLTPTGAAILTTIAEDWSTMPSMRPRAVGYGAGDHDLGDAPNVLRMVLGPEDGATRGGTGEVAVLECTLDDSTPQALAFASESLMRAGALDVFTTAVVMKKGRAGHALSVIALPDRVEELARLILEETSTIGLRFRTERRVELERTIRRVKTRYGTVGVKVSRLGERLLQAWPEYDDCAAAARRHGVPLDRVQREALRALPSPGKDRSER
jgi:uncharacterized protein (TIGR00299 family) protein